MRHWLRDNQYLIRAIICGILVPPALLWWKDSILFVIMISLATQIDTSLAAHEAHKARRENSRQD